MAFVVQCPFCKLKAKAPDRALGAMGKCPRCANSFTFASADDQHLPESVQAAEAADPEAPSGSALGAAIAEAAASRAEEAPLADVPAPVPPARLRTAQVGGALAFFLAGLALVGASVPLLFALVLPLSVLGLLIGTAAVAVASRSGGRLLFLPAVGSAAAAAILVVAWFFPALLGPAFEFSRRRPDPLPPGLQALPLGDAPALTEVPEWTDASRYALRQDGLRVEVREFGVLPPEKADAKAKTPPKERFVVSVRISQVGKDAKPIERTESAVPKLSDAPGQSYALLQTEFFDRGGADRPGLDAEPTIEETFVFEAPAKGWQNLRLELPARRWQGEGVFRFAIEAPAQP
jgi:hypothetical protein